MADSRVTQYTDLQGLAALRRDARAQDPAALREAARQFESVFTRMMLESMRDASGGDPMFDSEESRFYRDMFDSQLSVEMSRGRGLGLAEMLVSQVMRSGLTPQADAGGAAGSAASPQGAMPTGASPGAAPLGVAPVVTPRVAPVAAPSATAISPAASPAAATTSTPSRPVIRATAAAPAQASAVERPVNARALPAGRTPTRQEFLDAILPAAEKAAAQLGVSPRNLIAQAALETGWGRHMPRGADGRVSFNFFGIKATGNWRGGSVASSTTEVLQGRAQRMVERFRAYSSIEESVADHARLIGNSRRYQAVRGTGDDALAFGTALQRGGYATDPGYARKIAAVADSVGRLLEVRRADPAPGVPDRRDDRPLTAADIRRTAGRT
jgi:flagellar protein FlgJ